MLAGLSWDLDTSGVAADENWDIQKNAQKISFTDTRSTWFCDVYVE